MSTGEKGAPESGILTTANALTLLRCVLTVPFLYFVFTGRFSVALGVFLVAGLTDFADGYVARRFNQITAAGRLLDPLADKFLTTSAFVVMAVQHQGFPSIPVWLAIAVVVRDLVIVLGALAVYWRTGFSDFRPTMSGKITTAVELGVICGFLLFNTVGRFTSAMPFFYIITLVCLVVSGLQYLLNGLTIIRTSRPPAP